MSLVHPPTLGSLFNLAKIFLKDINYSILGCLSFEDRCSVVPRVMSSTRCQSIDLLEIIDPVDAYPNYTIESSRKIETNKQRLKSAKLPFRSERSDLLASEDQLLDILAACEFNNNTSTIIFDMSCFPKRYFFFFLKRLLLSASVQNLIVTYTFPGPHGYTQQNLAEDPMTCEHLPGFAGNIPIRDSLLAVSLGFEPLNFKSLLEGSGEKKQTKYILAFPPGGGAVRRQWNSLRRLGYAAEDINERNLVSIAAWDVEQIYKLLKQWHESSENMILAPFGAKPHSLGMLLSAIELNP